MKLLVFDTFSGTMNLEESVRQTKEQWSADPQLKIEREQVIDKYSEIFKLDNIDKLTPEIFKKFLRRDENKHWSKLDRVGGNLVKNMPKLKSGLKKLNEKFGKKNQYSKRNPS